MSTHRHAQVTPCPSCGKGLKFSTALNADTSPPRPGDVSVCAYCATTVVYTENLRLRRSTTADLAKLSPEEVKILAEAKRFILKARGDRLVYRRRH
jgi:hypothetical protein